MVTNHHTITLYPTLINRLTVRGWRAGRRIGLSYTYTKQRGDYVYVAEVNCKRNCATFTRYERITSSQQEIS